MKFEQRFKFTISFDPEFLLSVPGNYKGGERVAGYVHGGLDPEMNIRGAFSEYVVQEASLVFHFPSTILPEQIITFPLVSITAALRIFHEMKLSLPPANVQIDILVWAGTSPQRHEYLKGLGADIYFDYKDPNVVSLIKQATHGDLTYAFDCFSEFDSTKQICAALTGKDSQLVTVLPFIRAELPTHIKEHSVLLYTIFGIERNLFRQFYAQRQQDK
ncbi:unnamed protein product [Adineta ricciae]|uniref:Uncharacterized protein n=1 Tax=Adineta ricciae TaxID=249248 RepID=A0A815P1Y7_ADIRI|nr:unnamed protein product [Adineta ricciae]